MKPATKPITGANLVAEKAALRKHALAVRKKTHAAKADEASAAVAAHVSAAPLADWLADAAGAPVGVYMAAGSELNPAALIAHLRAAGFAFCLPICAADGAMAFRLFAPDATLKAGAHGVLEPPADAPLCAPKLVFVPLLAADKSGTRLGRGGGYYDKWLAGAEQTGQVKAVGLAYDAQIFAPLPCAAHDKKLHGILTPSGFMAIEESA